MAGPAPAALTAPAFENALDLYLGHLQVERQLAGNTQAAYGRDLTAFLAWLEKSGIRDFAGVSRDRVTAYFLELAGRLAARSRARALSAVRSFFGFLEAEGLAARNPIRNFSGPRLPRPVPKALGREETRRLVEAPAADTPLGLRDRAMFELIYASGLRVSELLDLELEQINLEDAFLKVRGKGRKKRLVPMGETAAGFLSRYLREARPRLLSARPPAAARKKNHVFLNRRGGRLSRQYFWRLLVRWAGRLGLAGATPHVLRHSFATHLVEGGANLRAVQMMLGHASLATTEIYIKTGVERLIRTHRRYHPRAGLDAAESET